MEVPARFLTEVRNRREVGVDQHPLTVLTKAGIIKKDARPKPGALQSDEVSLLIALFA